ncbi:MAG: ABC transporter substrate-binding protein/permease [Streptococcaceae bacterium]|jgi:putative lysine transport system permease protein|nr:ABC transporter substrate-binding protein/permease [Streptococcaceae bacterium]
MKKLLTTLLAFFAIFGTLTFAGQSASASSQKEFRVGMEAAYPPFNWTQNTAANGAYPIQGSNQYANGYDVQVAQALANKLNRKLVIVKSKWDGLIPALTSGKIDAIIAGMSPTPEREQTIDFSVAYETGQMGIIVKKNSKFGSGTTINNFAGAKITAQQGTFHYDLIDQLKGVNKQPAMGDFSAMRVALSSGVIDGYIAERVEGVTAEAKEPNFKFISLSGKEGFTMDYSMMVSSVGLRKGDSSLSTINAYLKSWPKSEQTALMDKMTKLQSNPDKISGFWNQVAFIWQQNWKQLVNSVGMTLLLSIIGTIVGFAIGLLIGVFRTMNKASNAFSRFLQRLLGWILNIYIEIFRGTPMMVQAMVIYYGSAQFLHLNIDRLLAAFLIVSINTGAYMSEIVRGGIYAVDEGQFEAAHALGFTHWQTMYKIVLPQAIRNILPAVGNEFVINIKDTSVLNVISVSELYFMGNTIAQQNYQYFQTFFIVSVIYLILTFSITRILRGIEHLLNRTSKTTMNPNKTIQETTGANQMQV